MRRPLLIVLQFYFFVLAIPAADIPVVIDLGAAPNPDGAVVLTLPTNQSLKSVTRDPAVPIPAVSHDMELVTDTGRTYSVSKCGDGVGRVLLPGLSGVHKFMLRSASKSDTAAQISVHPKQDDSFKLTWREQELATWQGGKGTLEPGYDEKLRRGGYLARLLTSGGQLVTDDMPSKHKHHHGIWLAWTKTKYDGRSPDFWNMGEGTGSVQSVSTSPVWTADVWAGWTAVNRYQDLTTTPKIDVLEEYLSYVVRCPLSTDPSVVVDLTIVQRCLTDKPLELPTYHYGGLGIRGNRAWEGEEGTLFLTSEGHTRADGNFTRGNWCWMGGIVKGIIGGLTVLAHPTNPRMPQPLRIHPKEPFFCFAPSQLGDWRIAPNLPLVQRYRIIATSGQPDPAGLQRLWQAYANEPIVTVGGKPVK